MKDFFKTIAGQIIVLTIGAVLLTVFMVFGVHLLTRHRVSVIMDKTDQEIVKITNVYQELQSMPTQNREMLLRFASNPEIRFTVSKRNMGEIDVSNYKEFSALRNRLEVESVYKTEKDISWNIASTFWFSNISTRCYMPDQGVIIPPDCPYTRISVPLNESEWFTIEEAPKSLRFLMMFPIVMTTVVFSSIIILVVFFLVNRITSPLKSLASAAKKLGRGEQIKLLETKGPSEIETTIEAFNNMQKRLTRFVDGRTQMLASISHDLRTPITSMRLRAEFIEDEELRNKIIATLLEMQTMVAACLRFSSQDLNLEESTTINLAKMLEDLSSEVPEILLSTDIISLNLVGRPISLRRAIRNVLDNAVHYGTRADISLNLSGNHAYISIQDQGPGIPADQIDEIFEPFVRLGQERNTESGNVGLGLSISQSIILSHGGTICANNTNPGLKVTISLPMI